MPNDHGTGLFNIAVETIAGWVAASVSALILIFSKSASSKVQSIQDQLENHGSRITCIESSYVKRGDLEAIVGVLRNDIDKSFDRAHERIDQLYQNGKNH